MNRKRNEERRAPNEAYNASLLQKAKDDSSSLLSRRDSNARASLISYETDTLSRFSVMFKFDNELLSSRPYRRAIVDTWRCLKLETRPIETKASRPASSSHPELLNNLLSVGADTGLGGLESMLAMVVQYDFQAETSEEVDFRKGEIISPVAIADEQWVVAKPMSRLGWPRLVPISYLSVSAGLERHVHRWRRRSRS